MMQCEQWTDSPHPDGSFLLAPAGNQDQHPCETEQSQAGRLRNGDNLIQRYRGGVIVKADGTRVFHNLEQEDTGARGQLRWESNVQACPGLKLMPVYCGSPPLMV